VSTPSGNDPYRFEWNYGPGGRVDTISYPTPDNEPSVVAKYVYDQAGYLRVVKDNALGGAVHWSLKEANASAMPRVETYGDGTTTTRIYDPQRLWAESIVHDKPGKTLAQLDYEWWPEGELHVRRDATAGQAETFEYDRQWRLTRATVNANPARVVGYDVFGNITSMTGAGPYVYDAGVRLSSFAGLPVQYDGAGNITKLDGRVFVYNTFGKVRTIERGGTTLSMSYDADGGRVRARRGDTQVDVVTLGKLYERRVNKNGTTAATTWRIEAGERVVAQIVRTRDNLGAYTTSNQYLHDDDLGSTVLVTASAGMGDVDTVARTSSDPWGRARNPDNWNAWQTDAQAGAVGIGFTGHRAELDHGLIDADGRMYDPTSGRFMAPDPLVTQAYAGAAYNRYAYVGNRPLRFTDPSGWAASDEDESEGESASFTDVVLGFFDEIEDLKTELDQATRNAASSSPLEQVEAFYETTIVEPAKFVRDGLQANIDNLEEGAKAIAEDPVGSAFEMAKGVAEDVKTVVMTPIEMGKAVTRGDTSEALAAHWKGAVSAWGLAGLVAGGIAKWAKQGVAAGEAGQFAALRKRSVVGDGLTPHHMPQAAAGFTSRAEGGALVMEQSEHVMTRTYLSKGAATARAEANLSFRAVLARDIRDVRKIVGTKYDQGLRDLLKYYRTNFPDLMAR
jgi:RHS repeat-associated protein